MLKAFYAYLENIKGAVLPLAAVSMVAILGTAAVGVDASYWAMSKRDLQTAADAAALAAGWEIANSTRGNAKFAAQREATLNGFDQTRNGNLTLEISLTEENEAVIDVTLSQETDIWFAGVIMREPMRISTFARALVTNVTGDFCIFGLDPNNSGAVTVDGTADVNSTECGIAVNSTSPSALSLTGSGSIDVDLIRIGGGYEIQGGSANLSYRQLFENQKALNDPYADMEIPYYHECSATETKQPLKVNQNGKVFLKPGVYCGGISISGTNHVVFEPGTYIIDSGDLAVIGGGSLYGDGVTFILTSSQNKYGQLDISGSRKIHLGAPDAGQDMEGIVFFQDRNAPDLNNLTNNLTGSSELIMDGVAYFPSQTLKYGGGYSTETKTCSMVIAKNVILSGTPLLNNNCEPKGVKQLKMPGVRLIG